MKTIDFISRPREFIAGMTCLTSIVALSIDTMMPALPQIGRDLHVSDPNDPQLIVSSVFIGLALGQVLYGPLADSFGRKKSIYLGGGIFLLGCVLALMSDDLTAMILSRVVQGFGAAAFRNVTTAMIRDSFESKEMARILSLMMIVFILVPILGPALGQLIIKFGSWRSIFLVFMVMAAGGVLWLHLRLPETLQIEYRRQFSFVIIIAAFKESCKQPLTRGYTIASGLVSGGFIGYLSSAQQIFQNKFGLGTSFPLAFGGLALSFGAAAYVNSRLVHKFILFKLCLWAMFFMAASSGIYVLLISIWGLENNLGVLMFFLAVILFCFGIISGNITTMALQPLGHIAGTATSVINSLQTLICVGIGILIGKLYNQTLYPVMLGFCTMGIGAWLITYYTSQFEVPEVPEYH